MVILRTLDIKLMVKATITINGNNLVQIIQDMVSGVVTEVMDIIEQHIMETILTR